MDDGPESSKMVKYGDPDYEDVLLKWFEEVGSNNSDVETECDENFAINSTLAKLRDKARRKFNRARNTGGWDDYKKAQDKYNKALRKAKRDSWRRYCEDIENTSECARLQKIPSREPHSSINTLRTDTGVFTTTTEETLKDLLKQLLQNYVFSSIVAHRDYIVYYFIMESCQAAEPNKKVLDNESSDNDLTTEMSSDEEQSS
ncbi:unnamed protein product [Callosobruchus maculatus]|uniref:Uncharacterized protein n=1 Tax=Callosobruchus maculatus TaxID=64391 RepID=A0A653BMA0_CALMS|nr:unnamed protein product [Callosobruchus maculatus]